MIKNNSNLSKTTTLIENENNESTQLIVLTRRTCLENPLNSFSTVTNDANTSNTETIERMLPPNLVRPLRIPRIESGRLSIPQEISNTRISNNFNDYFENTSRIFDEVKELSNNREDLMRNLEESGERLRSIQLKSSETEQIVRVPSEPVRVPNELLTRRFNSEITLHELQPVSHLSPTPRIPPPRIEFVPINTNPIVNEIHPLQPVEELTPVSSLLSTNVIEAMTENQTRLENIGIALNTLAVSLQEDSPSDIAYENSVRDVNIANESTQRRGEEYNREVESIQRQIEGEETRRSTFWFRIASGSLTALVSIWTLLSIFPAPGLIAFEALGVRLDNFISPNSSFSFLRTGVNLGANYFRGRMMMPGLNIGSTQSHQQTTVPRTYEVIGTVTPTNLQEPPSNEPDNWRLHPPTITDINVVRRMP